MIIQNFIASLIFERLFVVYYESFLFQRTETLVYKLASQFCMDEKSNVNTKLSVLTNSSTIIVVPELAHPQLYCHDYNSVAPLELMLKKFLNRFPSIDYIIMYATGGLKVRYIERSGHVERLAREYVLQHNSMNLGAADVCRYIF